MASQSSTDPGRKVGRQPGEKSSAAARELFGDTFVEHFAATREWEEGGVLVFDDSFEHEVRHLGAGPRATLVVQVVHPDLRGDYYDFMTR